MDKIPVWVYLPALPLQFWTLDYFKSIGNFLGEFLEADLSFEETKQRKVARIIVNLNVKEGLGEEIDLRWGSFIHSIILDYENVPFRCCCCHQCGHLVMNCHLPLRIWGRNFYRFKKKTVTQDKSSRPKECTDATAQDTTVLVQPTVASKETCQQDLSFSLEIQA